jgi:hypothetical protein
MSLPESLLCVITVIFPLEISSTSAVITFIMITYHQFLYIKQNNTWTLSWRYEIYLLVFKLDIKLEHSKINFISPHNHVLFSIYRWIRETNGADEISISSCPAWRAILRAYNRSNEIWLAWILGIYQGHTSFILVGQQLLVYKQNWSNVISGSLDIEKYTHCGAENFIFYLFHCRWVLTKLWAFMKLLWHYKYNRLLPWQRPYKII